MIYVPSPAFSEMFLGLALAFGLRVDDVLLPTSSTSIEPEVRDC